MDGDLPDERIVRQMEVGVAGFRYDRDGIFPSQIPDAELRRVACPTLVLVGDQEMIYDAAEATARARRLLPDVEAEIVPGVGHLLGVQRPEVVNPRLLAFLAERVGTGKRARQPVG
jgi:pimeloyl-ACP methyl ester carboxylesterase